MANKTSIEWTDYNWNFLRGCSRVSEGCRNCYAEGIAARFSGPGMAYEGLAKMGVGMPEYLLIFRKPQSDNTKAYADDPVKKSKQTYTRSRWQIDAHGFARSSGDRLLSSEDLKGVPHSTIYKLFRQHSLGKVYDFDHHVRLGESLDEDGRLPVTFMLLPPQSWSEDVWTDITRMRTLNANQCAKGKQMHLCPLQLDIVDRAVTQWSNPGDLVLDPFGGLGTVAHCAVKLGRRGYSIELNTDYWLDSLVYCEAAEQRANVPSLFDLEDEDEEIEEAATLQGFAASGAGSPDQSRAAAGQKEI